MMDELDKEALDSKWFSEYYEGFDNEEISLEEYEKKNQAIYDKAPTIVQRIFKPK